MPSFTLKETEVILHLIVIFALFAIAACSQTTANLTGTVTDQSGGVQNAVLPNTGLVVWSPRFILKRPSGSSRPLLLEPDIVIDEDPLRPDVAVDRLLDRTKPSSCVRS